MTVFRYPPHVQLAYGKRGTGTKALLFFHGFGQDHHVFDELTDALSQDYTCYVFDLFFHGQSTWAKGESAIEKTEWKDLLTQFLEEHRIENFSVLGFSMGGKFALSCLELFPLRIESVFLLAPDGIKTNFWYSLATYPIAFRKLFKSMINHHERFHTVARMALRLGFIDKGILRFIESQMNTEEKRKRVYYSWVVFRHFQFNPEKLAHYINEQNISFTLIAGKYDKIITVANMKPFIDKLKQVRFEVIEAGHNDLIRNAIPVIVNKKS